MAFTKEDIATLAGIAKISVEDFTKAATDAAEVKLPIPEKITSFTEVELNTFQKNKYESGKNDGVEKLVKDAAKEQGLEFTGKTIDGLIKAAQTKALEDAGKAPDQRVTELTKQIETLKGTVTGYEKDIAAKASENAGLRDNYELFRHIPPPIDGGVQYSQDEVITIMKMRGYEFKRDSTGKMQPYKDGEVMADKLGNALPVGDVVKGFMKEARYISDEEDKTPGGRGGKDKPGGTGGTPRTLSELKAKYEAAGKSMNGEEFGKEYEALVNAPNSTFDTNA